MHSKHALLRLVSRPLILAVLLSASAGLASAQEVDREFVLESTILGYTGRGGEIEGIRNPVLQAAKGETVRIVVVNAEPLVHDVAMEKLGIKSDPVLDVGQRASITFTAEENDIYYCSIPGHRQAGMEGRFEVSEGGIVKEEGVVPERNGRALNVDFESGNLTDWTAEGDAFSNQPVRDDSTGNYWIRSGGQGNSAPTGRLTSPTFEVTHPFASFLVAGGAFANTRVELVKADDQSVVFSITGYDGKVLRPAVADLSDHVGEAIFIRLVDEETGEPSNPFHAASPYAHIGFDQFRFHSARPAFANELRQEDLNPLPPLEILPYAGLSGQEAARVMTLPEGFSVKLAASEPDVVRPIGFSLDDRGRLWVAEGHTYPQRAPDGEGKDRILILEDTDGDGTLDDRKVFIEGLNLVSGIEVGFGGVWVGAAPYLLFIPMKDDRPAGEPQILLDGWGYHDTHETLNTLRWGPDGWLYGTQGVFTHSKIGKPGTPDDRRTPMNAGVWRYHPTRHEFEVFAHGTSNPWGLDWNEYGHAFITACVIPHLFHVVQGARFDRQAGEHFNPYTYEDIPTIADHVHWVGDQGWAAGSRRGGGGGHAHAGAMIYLGGSWPDEYRSKIMMNNIHGQRVNADVLSRSGSGYAAAHGEDFLHTQDAWSQMLNFRYGPNGSVYVIDWYDKNQCHSSNPDVHDKTLGRIFKITHKNDRPVQADLRKLSSDELVKLQTHENEWFVRHARRILQERGADPAVRRALRRMLDSASDPSHRLRALWSLHVTGGISDGDLQDLLRHDDEYVRSWAIQLIAEDAAVSDEAMAEFARMAREDDSPLVRLYLASAVQRLDKASSWDILAGLHSHAQDADDHNLPLMVWYATEPAVQLDYDRALDLALSSQLPRSLEFTVRRIAEDGSRGALQALSRRLVRVSEAEKKRVILEGINRLVKGPSEQKNGHDHD